MSNLSAAHRLPEEKHTCYPKGRLSEGHASPSAVLRPAASAFPRNLGEMPMPGPTPDPLNQKLQGWGPQAALSPLGESDMKLF